MAPCAGNKMTGARDLEAVEMRQALLKVHMSIREILMTSQLDAGISTDRHESSTRRSFRDF